MLLPGMSQDFGLLYAMLSHTGTAFISRQYVTAGYRAHRQNLGNGAAG